MAARYVNPDNITAQGQYFYTGLPPGSYDTGSAGGGNVYGAGSGGSGGGVPDRTGSDSSKTWDYKANISLNFGRMTNPPTSGKTDPSGTGGDGGGGTGPQHPVSIPTPGRRRTPVGNGGPQDPAIGARPALPALSGPDPMKALPGGSQGLPAITQGENPAQGDRPMLALPQYSEPTRARMDRRNTADRARRASMMPAKDFAFGMEALASSEGTQGMWGAFSASRSHSRPRTF